MNERTEERLAELLGAAAADELTAEEHAELDAWAGDDPAVAAERDAMVGLAARLEPVTWVETEPPARLEESVVGGADERRRSPWRRRAGLAAAAVALIAVGAGGTVAVQEVTGQPPQGPAGTLGAYEPVVFDADSDPADVDADLVAHTWGTEAVLTVDGLQAGTTYEVFFIDADGQPISAGAFLGSEVTIDCRVNAAVMREDVRALRITLQDGTVVRSADLPEVRG